MREFPQSRYDLETYSGRVKHCAQLSDPTTLFHSNKQILAAKERLDAFRNGKGDLTPSLWADKKIVDSAVHPDTGEIVFLPLRMSSYVLSNLVVCVGMLTPGLGVKGTLFWQITNQSLNTAVNTANANKSHPLTVKQLATSYLLAVGSSCSVALGLNAVVPRLKSLAPTTRTILGRLVPFAAVVTAGMVNVAVIRSEEMRRGITVYDQTTNEPLGESCSAARRAVFETALSRAITAAPTMVFPPLLLYRLQQGVLKNASFRMMTLVNLGIITATSFAVLPFALAIFPTRSRLDGSQLEPKFAGRQVWFNRGI